MSTNASTVGPVQFPVPAGDQDAPLRDPVAVTLLHFAAHWLNWGLSAKLENMRPTAKEAVPTSDAGVPLNLGDFDPGTAFVRLPLPALYCWCPTSVTEQWTMTKNLRRAEYHMRYYFQPLTMPGGMKSRSGVMQNADRLLHRASDERRHKTFPTTAVQTILAAVGVDMVADASVESALGLRELKLIRSIFGTTWEEAGQQSAGETISRNLGGGADGGVQRGFPTLHCVWSVKEVVGENQVEPTDETPDLQLLIKATTGEGEGYVDMMTRNLNAPDGAGPNQKDEFD